MAQSSKRIYAPDSQPAEDPFRFEMFSAMHSVFEAQQRGMSEVLEKLTESMVTSFAMALDNIVNKPQEMSVPKFNGRNCDSATWMCLYERACSQNHWLSDEQRINNLLGCFEPNSIAAKWFNGRIFEDLDMIWEEWKASFLVAFRENPVQSVSVALKFYYSSGDVIEFYYEKQRLLQLAFGRLPARPFNLLMLSGLPTYMQNLLMGSGTDLDSIQNFRQGMQRLKPIPLKKSDKSTRWNQPQFRNLPVGEKEQAGGKTTLTSEVYSSYLPGGTEGEPLVYSLHLNNKQIESLLDTGAMVNLVSRRITVENSWLCIQDNRILRGFNGSTERVSSAVDLEVCLEGRSVQARAYVSDHLPYDAIIGWPTLKALGIRLTRPGVSPINQVTEKVIQDVAYNRDDVCRLFPKQVSGLAGSTQQIRFLLKSDAPIVKLKPYRLTREKYNWAQQRIRELLDKGIIRESESDYASPCVIVPKENGNMRLCQDYRKVNDFTELDPFPFPLIDDIISSLGGCKFFTKLDLKDGFHQCSLSEGTKKYTSFVLPFGQYEFNKLPFGWKNSPPKFQRHMVNALGSLLEDSFIWVYIDDVIIGGYTKKECAMKTFHVIKKLTEENLQINLEKSVFCQPNVTFLGRQIDGENKTTKEESIQKVRGMKRPHNLHTIRVFTGLTGHFRAYIQDYAKIVKPLDRLKEKGVEFTWTDECEKSFKILVDKISSNPVLKLPDWKLGFELCTDASNYGCGAILYQRDPAKPKKMQLRVIGYYSYSFSKAEVNYSVTEKEGLAVIKAIQYFQSYLEGRDFVIHTDHQALAHIMTMREAKGRLARWQIFLMGFNVRINHRKGSELEDADALSRLCIEPPFAEQHLLSINAVIKNTSGKIQVDPRKKSELLKSYHDNADSGGHDGFMRTYIKLRQRFTWPGMRTDVLNYVRSCHLCQVLKFKYKAKPDSLVIPNMASTSFHTLHLDFGELTKRSEGQNSTKSFLIAVDEHSRFTFSKSMKETSAAVIKFLQGLPIIDKVKTVVTDNGPQFTSKLFGKFAQDRGIRLIHTAPYHPAGNGLAERKIRDVKQFLTMYPLFRGGWKACLEAAVKHLNRSYSSGIGCSPCFKAYGKIQLYPADASYGITEDMIQETPLTDEQRDKYQTTMKANFDRRHSKTVPSLQVGDHILVQAGYANKTPIVKGPYVIHKIITMNGYPKNVIYKDESNKEQVAAIKNLLKYHNRSDDATSQVGEDVTS